MTLTQIWRFLSPSVLPWTVRRAWDIVVDRLKRAPPRTVRAREFVEATAKRGDPEDVLRALDRFAREVRFLMSVGPEKGPLMAELLDPLPENARVLELGAYCGYSAILIAQRLGPGGRLVSVEKDPVAAEVARANVAYAGLSERVEVIQGASESVIPTLEGPFDLVFLDHWKDLYEPDLRRLEAGGLLRPGSTVVADNVVYLVWLPILLQLPRLRAELRSLRHREPPRDGRVQQHSRCRGDLRLQGRRRAIVMAA